MDVILMGGLWLTADVWREVAEGVQARGHRPVALTLPGQGDGNSRATLDDQVATAVVAVDAVDGKALLVGHSGASTLAWLAADLRVDKVGAVAMIGGVPAADGQPYFDGLAVVDGSLPFPGWAQFEGPDSADLDDTARASFEATAVPVPAGVVQAPVRYTDARRQDIPVTLICPEFSPEQAREWVESGDVPELEVVAALAYVDIDSGHWPMLTQPAALAMIIADLADRHTVAG